jgi:beta-lactamase class A
VDTSKESIVPDESNDAEKPEYSEQISNISESEDHSQNCYSEYDNFSILSEDSSIILDSSEVFSSFEVENSFEDTSSENSSSQNNNSEYHHTVFCEPQGKAHTTEKGNVFETNCSDEVILALMGNIADVASKYNKATVYYTDVEQKFFFAYGASNIHNTASTIKAPYAAYLLKSGADLSEVLVMEKRHILTGSGVLKNKKVGSKFTVSDLIKYMITRSDNTAYAMLLERFGTKGFREYSQSLGIDYKLPAGGYTTCTIREMATFMLDIYHFGETEEGKDLIKHMQNCSYSLQISKAVQYPVAHKFGFIYEGKGFHDMGIVYSPAPYLELIFTRINGTVYDTKAFIEIGKLIEELNQAISDEY